MRNLLFMLLVAVVGIGVWSCGEDEVVEDNRGKRVELMKKKVVDEIYNLAESNSITDLIFLDLRGDPIKFDEKLNLREPFIVHYRINKQVEEKRVEGDNERGKIKSQIDCCDIEYVSSNEPNPANPFVVTVTERGLQWQPGKDQFLHLKLEELDLNGVITGIIYEEYFLSYATFSSVSCSMPLGYYYSAMVYPSGTLPLGCYKATVKKGFEINNQNMYFCSMDFVEETCYGKE